MNRTYVSLMTLSFAAFLIIGCGEKLPDGMPRLYPVSMTVTMDGAPLAGASVQLVAEDQANAQWGPGGLTNASGVAELSTNGRYKGAPLGTYKVAVSKQDIEKHPNPEWANLPPDDPNYRKYLAIGENLKAFEAVDSKFGRIADTPLRVEITAKSKSYTVEVEKNPKR